VAGRFSDDGCVDAAAMSRLCLVVPCYNEAERLDPMPFLQMVQSRSDVGFLFVNDGSTDATATVLADVVARGNGRIAALNLEQNVGKAGAVRAGIQSAFDRSSELVGYWDADLSTPLEAIPQFLDVLDRQPQIEIVMGARVKLLGRNIDRYAVRHYSGRLFATAASVVLKLPVYDTQCGAKLFRVNDAVRQAFSAPFRSRWIFDVELLARYVAATGSDVAVSRIYELPLTTWTDVPGSKLRPWHAVRAAWEITQIWRKPV
jgi:glycosyltransferase involved in cell wall biosynthesis